jgi:hypothetical protein
MNDRFIRAICWLLKVTLWRGRTLGSENLPQRGPAIFIGNHSATLGPIACVCSAGVRLYPWIRFEMVDAEHAPACLQAEFVEQDLRLRPPLSAWLAGILAHLTVPLLRGIGCIPVYTSEDLSLVRVTLQTSLELLLAGKSLLVFPEKPQWRADPLTHIHRFSKGVLWLVELYYIQTGLPLPIIPFSVHAVHRQICFHPPFNLTLRALEDYGGKEAWIRTIEREVREGYWQLAMGDWPGAHR